jgi:hypothetical protein
MFDDYAIIRPMYEGSKVTLRPEKYSENWGWDTPDGGDPFDFTNRKVCEEIHREIHPEDFEDEEEE